MTYCYSVYHDNFRDSTGQCTGIHRRITGSSPGRTDRPCQSRESALPRCASLTDSFACASPESRRRCRHLPKISCVPRLFNLSSLIIAEQTFESIRIMRGRASTASVATLAKKRRGLTPGFSCRAASKSGEHPHRKKRALSADRRNALFCIGIVPSPYVREKLRKLTSYTLITGMCRIRRE